MVIAGVYLLLRVSPLLEYCNTVLLVVMWVGALTSLMGATSGLFQNDLKRVIAYSTTSQLGMLLVACGLSQYNLALFHLTNHAFFKALLFLSAGAVIHAFNDEQDLRRYGALASILPFTFIMMIIGSISLMAIPFLTGFYSKDLIIESASGMYSLNGHSIYWVIVIAALFTASYSARAIYLTFLGQPNGPKQAYLGAHEPSLDMAVPLVILATLSIFLGYVAKDLYVGLGTDFFDSSLYTHPRHVIQVEAEFSLPLYIKLLPATGSILAATFVLLLYEWSLPLLLGLTHTPIGRRVYVLFNQKWHFDALYSTLLAPLLGFGLVTNKVIDRGALEIIGPYGVVLLFRDISRRLSALDTGSISQYALYIIVGLLSLAFFIFYAQDAKLLILVLCSLTLRP